MTKPFQHLHIDTAGPFIRGKKKWYVVLVIDHYSRYLHTFICDNKGEIRNHLTSWMKEQYLLWNRCPEVITADQGSEFTDLFLVLTPEELFPNRKIGDVPPVYQQDQAFFIPMDKASTGNKEWNGTAERTVQTLKLLQKMITAHLPPGSEPKYFVESFTYATMIYNHLPHSAIERTQPIGRYYGRLRTNGKEQLTEQEHKEREEYVASQPAHLFTGKSETLPSLPMFLEDVLFFTAPKGSPEAHYGYFVGYDKNYKRIVYDQRHKEHLVSDVKGMKSFLVHRNMPLRKANETLNASDYLPNNYKAFMTKTINKSEEEQFIPKNIKQAFVNEEWTAATNKEKQSFIDHNVFEEYHGVTPPDNGIELHTFWLFTRKLPDHTAKARLITINRDWVGKKQKDATSSVAEQLSCFLMLNHYANNNELNITTYDISTAVLYAKVPDDVTYYLKAPIGFDFQTKYVLLKKQAYGLNTSPLAFHKKLVEVLHELVEDAVSDPCLHRTADFRTFLIEHVDDIMVLTQNKSQIEELLLKHFKLKINDPPEYYLGYDILPSTGELKLSLETYIEQAINDFPEDLILYLKLPTYRTGDIKPDGGELPQLKKGRLSRKYGKVFNSSLEPLQFEDFDIMELTPPDADAKAFQTMLTDTIRKMKQSGTGKERYAHLEALVLKLHGAQDYTEFYAKHPLFPHHQFSLRMYQKVVGTLIYIATKGRFDVQVHASMLSQFSSMPKIQHFFQALQVLRYVYSTRSSHYQFIRHDTALKKKANGKIKEPITLDVYTDASQLPHASQGGYYITSKHRYITSKSFRIQHYAGCSYYAEMLALRTGIEAAVTVKEHLRDFGYKKVLINVHCDNFPLVQLVRKGFSSKKDMDKILLNCYYMLRDNFKDDVFDIAHVSGAANPADLLTKTLGFTAMVKLMEHPDIASTFTLILNAYPQKLESSID